MLRSPVLSPVIIALVAAFVAAAGVLTLFLASTAPWLGTQLVPYDNFVVVERVVLDLEHAVVVTGLAAVGETPLAITPRDLIAEPDGLETYAELSAFYDRQDQFFALLGEPQLDLH